MAKTLDVGTENEYNMSYIDIDRVSIEGLIWKSDQRRDAQRHNVGRSFYVML